MTTIATGNPIITKIAKVLAKADALLASDDPRYVTEGELASKLAAKMMREHAISMVDVKGVSLETDPLIEGGIDVGRVTWRIHLVWALSEHCNCKALRSSVTTNREWDPIRKKYLKKGSQYAKARLFGHKTDVEVCAYLYEICERQIEAATKKYIRDRKKDGLRTEYGKSMSFRESAVAGLSAKLKEIRDAGKAEDPNGTALVLSRLQKSDDFMHSITTPSKKHYKGGARTFSHDGYEAGKKIQLHAGMGKAEPAGTLAGEE